MISIRVSLPSSIRSVLGCIGDYLNAGSRLNQAPQILQQEK
jgi:hypothetical protein